MIFQAGYPNKIPIYDLKLLKKYRLNRTAKKNIWQF